MSTFSTTVTKTQRNARDFDSRGREISICSRQHTKRPGYNPSPYEPKVTTKITQTLVKDLREKILGPSKQEASHAKLQVRPNTKRGQRQNKPESKDMKLPSMTIEKFLAAIGCAYAAHSKTGCSAKQQQLLREIGFIK